MSRLTKKEKWINPFTNVEFNYKVDGDLGAIEKLGKIEDFEEILGCPLEVVFKLRIEESIIVKGYDGEFETWESDDFQVAWTKEPYILVFNNDGYMLRTYKLKDYGKTWWLKEKEIS